MGRNSLIGDRPGQCLVSDGFETKIGRADKAKPIQTERFDIHTLGHVWMPPLAQGFSERYEHVIECCHVSDLFVRRCLWPLAGMEIRGSEANH